MAPCGVMGSPTRMLEVLCFNFQLLLLVQRLEGSCGQKAAIVCRVKQGGIVYSCPQKRGNAVSLGFRGLR